MKKILFSILIAIFSLNLFALVPDEFVGIWQGSDRVLFFSPEGEFSVILKLYYGWYYDVASDKGDFPERKRNAATSKTPQNISVDFAQIRSDIPNAYEITLKFDEKTQSKIPVALINNCLYLDFLIKDNSVTVLEKGINGATATNISDDKSNLYGFWQSINAAENIRIAPRDNAKNIYSWYITPQAMYRLRFWQTDMEYSQESEAAFTDGENSFPVKKHIFSCGKNYTCANGRRSRIRNIEKFSEVPFEFTMNEQKNVIALNSRFFTRANVSNREELIKIVKEANSRRKPDPKPLFPEKKLDWHWDLINQLEKGNKIIEEVRKRQGKM